MRVAPYISKLSVGLLLLLCCGTASAEEASSEAAARDLLLKAKAAFDEKKYDQAATVLERAVRIVPKNAALWHNLAGVNLMQGDAQKAASLAAKSNSYAGSDKWLRIRNWTLIALACKELGDMECSREAKSRAAALNH